MLYPKIKLRKNKKKKINRVKESINNILKIFTNKEYFILFLLKVFHF